MLDTEYIKWTSIWAVKILLMALFITFLNWFMAFKDLLSRLTIHDDRARQPFFGFSPWNNDRMSNICTDCGWQSPSTSILSLWQQPRLWQVCAYAQTHICADSPKSLLLAVTLIYTCIRTKILCAGPFITQNGWECSGSVLECLPPDRGVTGLSLTGVTALNCGPWARHIYPSLVMVQPRKTRPCLTERLLMRRKESNQTKKTITKMVADTGYCNMQFSRHIREKTKSV